MSYLSASTSRRRLHTPHPLSTSGPNASPSAAAHNSPTDEHCYPEFATQNHYLESLPRVSYLESYLESLPRIHYLESTT